VIVVVVVVVVVVIVVVTVELPVEMINVRVQQLCVRRLALIASSTMITDVKPAPNSNKLGAVLGTASIQEGAVSDDESRRDWPFKVSLH